MRKGWTTKVSRYFTMKNRKAMYVYDFGDYWEHEVVLEKILPAAEGQEYPCCIAGEGRAPPDDVGGVGRYEEFVEIMNNPDHPEYEETAQWYGDDFDPADFDIREIFFSDPAAMLRLMQE